MNGKLPIDVLLSRPAFGKASRPRYARWTQEERERLKQAVEHGLKENEMNMAEQALETAQGVFLAHRNSCSNGCKNFVLHNTKTLGCMCLHGTLLYKSLLKAEENILKQEKAKEAAKEARAIRRENAKQMHE